MEVSYLNLWALCHGRNRLAAVVDDLDGSDDDDDDDDDDLQTHARLRGWLLLL